VSAAAPGGPKAMSQAEAVAILSPGSVAGICTEDAAGVLRAVPVWIEQAAQDTVIARLVGHDDAPAGPACLVGD
jgi:hypothetical protein